MFCPEVASQDTNREKIRKHDNINVWLILPKSFIYFHCNLNINVWKIIINCNLNVHVNFDWKLPKFLKSGHFLEKETYDVKKSMITNGIVFVVGFFTIVESDVNYVLAICRIFHYSKFNLRN